MTSNFPLFKKLIAINSNLSINNLQAEVESSGYDGYSFIINNNIQFRGAKITPKKIGQFATFYKRLPSNIIVPYDHDDSIDFFVIYLEDEQGLFIFPKNILKEKNIISQNNIDGKRGFRVYQPHEITISKQAKITQAWQKEFYIDFLNNNSTLLTSLIQNSNS